MSLAEIKNELYKKNTAEDVLTHSKSEFDPNISPKYLNNSSSIKEDLWEEKQNNLISENKKIIKLGVFIFLGVILVIGFIFGFSWIRQALFSSSRVAISIEGSRNITSGNSVVYEIKYKNENRVDLKDVVLKLNYPEVFRLDENVNFKADGATGGSFNLGTIKGNTEGKVSFSGKAYSPKGGLVKINANLEYIPSIIGGKFSITDQLAIGVSASLVTLEIQAPQNISNGDEINYLVIYKNEGLTTLSGVSVRATYPEQFIFSRSDLNVSENNNVWYLGNLDPGQSGKIIITGKLEGRKADSGLANFIIGTNESGNFIAYNEGSVQTKINASSLTITQTVNGLRTLNVNAGQKLFFELTYKNEGGIGLRDVIVTEKLDSPILDYASLDLSGGIYDTATKTIVWKASDYKELKNLAPGQGGIIKFSIGIMNIIPVVNANDKNFIVSSIAKIDSPDISTPVNANKIIASNEINMKLNSKAVLSVKGFYADAKISNTGPIPPKVDQETTYTLYFSVLNVSNDITDAKVEAILPSTVVFTGKIFPIDSTFDYNKRNNSIIWNLGTVSSGTGIISPAREIAFQVRLKPVLNQVGREAILLNQATFSAKDSFTMEDVFFSAEAKTTKLFEDSSIRKFDVIN